MKIWYAFEVVTDTAFHLEAYLSIQDRNMRFQKVMTEQVLPVINFTIGTVKAKTVDEALNNIRMGNWFYNSNATFEE